MFPFPSVKEETSEENASAESHPGGGALTPEEVTHNALQHTWNAEQEVTTNSELTSRRVQTGQRQKDDVMVKQIVASYSNLTLV